jgi:uncharacterized protein
MSTADEIQKLNDLRERGAITEEEYQKAKARLLNPPPSTADRLGQAVDGVAANENLWSMFIHLSQFCGYVVPLAGMVVPIVLWQMKKNESRTIDLHGRIVTNWLITEFILAVVFGLLTFIVVGMPLLIALLVVGVVFPIIGGIKANNGEAWPYPCSIRFFALNA